MLNRTTLSLVLLATLAGAGEKLSPFTAVEFEGNTPFVRYEGEWYQLLELEERKAQDIIAFCKKAYGHRWEKRFAEDLVEVMDKMGLKARAFVSLTLRHKKSGKTKSVGKAKMTEANRKAVWRARKESQPRARRRTESAPLDTGNARADVEWLRETLKRRHSYHFRKPGVLDGFRLTEKQLEGGTISRKELALCVARMVAPLGDGHTRVRGRWNWLPTGFAPFTVSIAGQHYVATAGGRALAEGFPILTSIDGIAIQRWIDATKDIVAHGSPQFRREGAANHLEFINYLRGRLELPIQPNVSVELASMSGERKTLSLPIHPRPMRPASWPLGRTRVLEGNIGYLRIPSMTSDARARHVWNTAMRSFRKTRGLVIDVRGNGGGSRDALRTLLPYFLDAPRVVNVACYRMPEEERPNPNGHLQNRYLYPTTWSDWTAAEKRAIETFRKTFRAAWTPPAKAFSAWHFMVVSPGSKEQRYRKPVVVLLDSRCFSATDIFLGGFRGVPGVTLLGTASGGGSGRSEKLQLAHSRIRLRMSTMASFQPDGSPYDGHGVLPDIVVEAKPTDWIGETDTQLEAALKRLRKS